MEEAVAMLKIAEQAGTTDIAATPHASRNFPFQPELIEQKLAELTAAYGGPVRLHRGCDFHLEFDNIQDALANPTKYTIDQTAYLLVELSDVVSLTTVTEVLTRLRRAGITPVITHPERNLLLRRRVAELETWVRDGCLVQVTGQSFEGRFGRDAQNCSAKLMKRGLVQIVASDAHDAQDRTPRLDQAYRHVAEHFGEQRAEELFVTNPRAVLDGAEVVASEPLPVTVRKWFQFRG